MSRLGRCRYLLVFLGLLLSSCGRAERTAPAPAKPSAAPAGAAPAAALPSGSVVKQGHEESVSSERGSVARVSGAALRRILQEHGGQGTLLNVWATWCGPCRQELPMLRSLQDNLKSRGLAIVLVSVDEAEAEPEVARMLQQQGFDGPYYVAQRPLGAFKQAMHPGWAGMIPVTFLFDATGRRRYFWGGPVYEHEMLPILEGFLAGEPIDGEALFELAPGQKTAP